MVSFEERIRADVAMAFASHDYNGSGAVDEQRLKAVGAEVLPKIDKLLRDAPDFGKNCGASRSSTTRHARTPSC